MSITSIITCDEENMQEFSSIMYSGFIDKYPKFFYGLDKLSSIDLIYQLNLHEYLHQKEKNKFIIKEGADYAGGILVYYSKKKTSFRTTFRILRNYLGFFKSLAASFMLIGFGPPLKFPKDTMVIDKLAIKDNHRRKGFGKKLLEFAIESAKNSGLKYIELEVVSENIGAITLYKQYGFKIIKTTKTPLGEIFVGVAKYHQMRKEL
ncbi:MAG: GNAT family N-acetyltransferase [Candidatus Heimdallarchaeota archaeon]